GTCTGLILMASRVDDSRVQSLNLLNIGVVRNSYGRQVDSFTAPLDLVLGGETVSLRGIFIRAPRISSVGSGTEVLGSLEGEPVMVQENHFLGCTFHPELSDSTAVHDYFVSMVKELEFAG
ncbi:MAG: pyridoxal 5'-phosphate synthase glutaminase subunit PdxT, partial [Candidatus Neomarinimicrobiota bacterium]